MKIRKKTLSVLTLICCFALTATAQNYYPSDIGNTWVFLSADGSEQLTYTLESPEASDVEGLIVLKITTETPWDRRNHRRHILANR